MSQEERYTKKSAAESFGEMIKSFGEAISEIFSDPELKEKAREFGMSAAKSAQTFANRFQVLHRLIEPDILTVSIF
jgi:ribosomal-protein-alanine N-acetyltransferase